MPALQKPDDFLYVINKVFYKKSDHLWVEAIDTGLWVQFFQGLGIQINLTEPKLIGQLKQSLQILSYRITTLGLEKEMTQRYENFNDAVEPIEVGYNYGGIAQLQSKYTMDKGAT